MHAVLRMCCPDRAGIVAELSNFLFRNRGNIVHLDKHVDSQANVFFARIEQDVIRVSHRDSVSDFIRRGKDLEKVVLARAVWHHVGHKILSYGDKTVVF